RSGGDPVGAQARPRPAQSLVDRRRRPHADALETADANRGCLALASAARDAALLPAGGALRHGPARLRARVATAYSGAERCADDRGARQRRQGTAGAAERRLAPGDGGFPGRYRRTQRGEEEQRSAFEMAVSLLRRKRPPDAAAF